MNPSHHTLDYRAGYYDGLRAAISLCRLMRHTTVLNLGISLEAILAQSLAEDSLIPSGVPSAPRSHEEE